MVTRKVYLQFSVPVAAVLEAQRLKLVVPDRERLRVRL